MFVGETPGVAGVVFSHELGTVPRTEPNSCDPFLEDTLGALNLYAISSGSLSRTSEASVLCSLGCRQRACSQTFANFRLIVADL